MCVKTRHMIHNQNPYISAKWGHIVVYSLIWGLYSYIWPSYKGNIHVYSTPIQVGALRNQKTGAQSLELKPYSKTLELCTSLEWNCNLKFLKIIRGFLRPSGIWRSNYFLYTALVSLVAWDLTILVCVKYLAVNIQDLAF